MIKLIKDPALTTSPTLAIMVGRHEIYLWRDGHRPRGTYYNNPYYIKGQRPDVV